MGSPAGDEYSLYGGTAFFAWLPLALIYVVIILVGAGFIAGGPVIADARTPSPDCLLEY